MRDIAKRVLQIERFPNLLSSFSLSDNFHSNKKITQEMMFLSKIFKASVTEMNEF